ncbi:hypothetical protein MKZ38_001799 [Zalerion maritima]|uniref:NACHT domain-containing protein n=1 Tax=Zalerion maritima TaxID=339359 RepID=A0AAD5RXH5_9PEZI|nr:hypothetical protein MKZ38_001799 [Zalerion maritima]
MDPIHSLSGDAQTAVAPPSPNVAHSPSAPWKTAVDLFRSTLSGGGDEWGGFATSDGPEDIVEEFRVSQLSRIQASRVHDVVTKMQPFVLFFERFARSLDVISNACPEIMSPAWGLLRAVLLVARESDTYFLRLIDMLQQMGDRIPRLKAYERLFGQAPSLQEALSGLYLGFVQFLAKANKVFSKKSRLFFRHVFWKPFEQTFQESLAQIRRYNEQVEREANLAHMTEQSRMIPALVETLHTTAASLLVPLATIRTWLDARQCHEELDTVNPLRGTCEWILKRPEVHDWTDNCEGRRFLWLHGIAGCGKSFLYGTLVRYLMKRGPCIYFLFCGADHERVTVSALLQSWTFQLATLFPQAREFVSKEIRDGTNSKATNAEVRSLFLALLELIPISFLTVDALDECVDRKELFRLISLIPDRFKVFTTSRSTPDIESNMRQYPRQYLHLEVTPDLNEADIKLYVDYELATDRPSCSEDVLERMRHQLLSESNGMIFWVRLMLQHIRDQTTEEEIRHCLNELPETLTKRYDCIMASINSLRPARRLLAHKTFFWITVARRPLEMKELCALLAVRPGADLSGAFDQDRRLLDPEPMVMHACGGLVSARGHKRTVYPIHFTVTEYVRDYVLEGSGTLRDMAAYYEMRQLTSSHALAAAVCIRYLSSDILTEALRDRFPATDEQADELFFEPDVSCLDALRYATMQWAHHFKEVEQGGLDPSLLQIARDLLDTSRPNLEYCWRLYWMATTAASPARCLREVDGQINPATENLAQEVRNPDNGFSALQVVTHFGLAHLVTNLMCSTSRNQTPR